MSHTVTDTRPPEEELPPPPPLIATGVVEAPTPPPLDGLELVAAKDEAALDVALAPNEAKDTPNDAEDSAPLLSAPVVEVVPAAAADLADAALEFVDP